MICYTHHFVALKWAKLDKYARKWGKRLEGMAKNDRRSTLRGIIYDLSPMNPEFKLISCKEAIEQHHIDKKIYESQEVFDDIISANSCFYIYDGNLELKDHFILNTDTLVDTAEGKRVEGYIITGHLKVNGNIINEEGDYGPALYVGGNVVCRSLLIGGSPTHIAGNVTAEEIIMLHYNHGWMKCGGVFTAPVFIAEDYHFIPSEKNIASFYYNDRDPESPENNSCEEDEEGEEVIAESLRLLLNNPLTTGFEELRRDLAAGEYVLKPQEKGELYWKRKVKHNWRDLKRVPMALRNRDICMLALDKGVGALEYFPDKWLDEEVAVYAVRKSGIALRYLPDRFITKELCYLGSQHSAVLKYDIPERFFEYDLILEVIQQNDHQIQFLPVSWLSEDLLVAYVKAGRGAHLDMYCLKAGVSKSRVLERVLEDGDQYLENIFGWHLSLQTYEYAQKLYDNSDHQQAWTGITERYRHKIARIKK